MAEYRKVYVVVGDTFLVTLGASEVCMHMRIVGKRMAATLVSDHAVQLLNDDGTPFSFPITTGEASVYSDEFRRHYVTEATPVVNAFGELEYDGQALVS